MHTIEELCSLITRADQSYYRLGQRQIMTDKEYDLLKAELKRLAPDHPVATRVGAPYVADEIGNKVPHLIPMGSLDNTDEKIIGFHDWFKKCCAALGRVPTLFASYKMDGASIALYYTDGKLTRAISRGNGEVGEDITANAALFRGVPLYLPKPITCAVRGEAILPLEDFNDLVAAGKADSGPRQVGNGILGRSDGEGSDTLSLYAFDLVYQNGDPQPDTEEEKFKALESLGFTPAYYLVCANVVSFTQFYDATLEKRDSLPFQIDGMVVKLNEYDAQQFFVTEDRKSVMRPQYARAVKYPEYGATTTLVDVLLTVGHTGAIIPTGALKPVMLNGSEVTRALLNNWDEIERLGIAIGDEVTVILAGDIIPKVIAKAADGANRILIPPPTECCACGGPVQKSWRDKESVHYYCISPDCSGQGIGKINKWLGNAKNGLGILGMGDAIQEAIWRDKLVRDPADLYTLTVDKLAGVVLESGGRVGTARAKAIYDELHSKKQIPLHVFLGSLGIDLLGKRRVEILAKAAPGQLDTLDDWLGPKLGFIQVPGLGDTIRKAVVAGLAACQPLITKLLAQGIEVLPMSTNKTETKSDDTAIVPADQAPAVPGATGGKAGIKGRSFCFTGTRECLAEVQAAGGEIKSGVSKGLEFLVQKDVTSQSGKTQKAEQYGTKIISIDFLREVLTGNATLP